MPFFKVNTDYITCLSVKKIMYELFGEDYDLMNNSGIVFMEVGEEDEKNMDIRCFINTFF